MIERQKHLDAFEYFIQLGGQPNDENTMKTAQEFGVSKRTIFVWYKEFHWKDRAIIRLVAAKKKLEEDGILSKEAEIASLLTLVNDKLDENRVRGGYLKALYGTAKEKIENKEIELKTMNDLLALSKAIDFSEKSTQDLIKLKLVILGEPDSRRDHTGDVGFTLYNFEGRQPDVSGFPPDGNTSSGKVAEDDDT